MNKSYTSTSNLNDVPCFIIPETFYNLNKLIQIIKLYCR